MNPGGQALNPLLLVTKLYTEEGDESQSYYLMFKKLGRNLAGMVEEDRTDIHKSKTLIIK